MAAQDTNNISAYFGVPINPRVEATGLFFNMNHGGSSDWVIEPPPAKDAKGLLWTTPYEGARYVFVFYPRDAETPLSETPFYKLFRHLAGDGGLKGVSKDSVYVYQTNAMLPEYDVDTEMWFGLEADAIGGTLCVIDTCPESSTPSDSSSEEEATALTTAGKGSITRRN